MAEDAEFPFLHEGQTFRSVPATITAGEIKAFAADFDPQPQHLDEEAAATSQFGGLVASGWHTAALAMRLFVAALPDFPGGAMGIGVDRLRWLRPVRPGDKLSVTATIDELRPSASKPSKQVVTSRVDLSNQDCVKVLTFTTTMLVAISPDKVSGEE